MKRPQIGIYVQALDLLVLKKQAEFPAFRAFNDYKKQQIQCYRNQLLARHLGCSEDQLQVARHSQGKPFLSSHSLYFNHSHSQDTYALAVSSTVQDIGIDIESLDRKIRFEALAKHAFHPDEYQCWKALGEDVHYWFKVWTTKEALLKAHGMGIRLDLNSLNTHMHPTHDSGQIVDERLGIFAYQCFDLGHAMLSVAWRSGRGCGVLIVPKIEIFKDSR